MTDFKNSWGTPFSLQMGSPFSSIPTTSGYSRNGVIEIGPFLIFQIPKFRSHKRWPYNGNPSEKYPNVGSVGYVQFGTRMYCLVFGVHEYV